MTSARFTLGQLREAAAATRFLDGIRAELAEFAAEQVERTGVVDFLDAVTGDAFDVNPQAAMAYFKAKGLRPTFHYADMLGEANDHAFTVAKMMDVDMLAQVRNSLDAALATGQSFGDWKKTIEPVLKSGGWWGEADMVDPLTGKTVRSQLGSPWRLETIFRTNMQTAYAAGQWAEIEEQAEFAPFLMFDAIDDLRTRAEHRAWDRTVLTVTHKWWNTHYPPCGYNCRCGVLQFSAEELEEMGLSVAAEAPPGGLRKWTNPRTGVVERVPEGVDPGFDHNSGKSLLADIKRTLDEKINVLPDKPMQDAAKAGARQEFNTGTQAGRWHDASFNDAPDWLRDAVMSSPDVVVESGGQGAYAMRDRLVNMGSHDAKNGERSTSVWRHEFGHIMDARGAPGLYHSHERPFAAAMADDADVMVRAAGKGRASKSLEKHQAERVADYTQAQQAVLDTPSGQREKALRAMAEAADVDFDGLLSIIKASTLVLEGPGTLESVSVVARVARMIVAIRRGDVEQFLTMATFRDFPLESAAMKAWRVDGAVNSLSDLAGAATKNKVASYENGFAGHSTSYYGQAAWMQGTEAFANLTALAGHPIAYWWTLTQRFAPRMAEQFKTIIEAKR